ncbi:MAG: hypothetical protein WBZ24_07600, partial [Anaerolineales bacterium]
GKVAPSGASGAMLGPEGNRNNRQGEAASRPQMPGDLSAFRLAPGVDLLIDPVQVLDPQDLARRLQAALEGQG